MIHQYGKGSPAVTLRLLEVLRSVAGCLDDPERHWELRPVMPSRSAATRGTTRHIAGLEKRYAGALAALHSDGCGKNPALPG